MRLPYILCPLLAVITSCSLSAASLSVASPDGRIELTLDDNNLTYQVQFNGKPVIAPSALGFRFLQLPAIDSGYKISNHSRNSVNQRWQQPWGERTTVVDQHNELAVTLKHPERKAAFTLRFKLFNDGLGFRYEVPNQGVAKLDIIDELTEFRISDSKQSTAWWIPGRGWNRYEMLYRTTALNEVDRAHTPFTFKLPSGVHLSIHEAALVDFAGMVLDQQRDGVLKSDLTPWSDGIRVKTSGSFTTPWRTIQIANNAVGLLNSDLILNLNEPNKLGEVSWVKPGKYAGIWWGMHLETQSWGSGPKHGATTKNTKQYIDFAAKNGFDGVLVEGWNTGWDGEWFLNGEVFNFTTPYADFDLVEVTAYGAAKGVKLVGHHETSGHISNYEAQMAAAYDLYAKHGVSQIKTGYVADGGQATHLLVHEVDAGRDDQAVVGQFAAAGQLHRALDRVDAVDHVAHHLHAVALAQVVVRRGDVGHGLVTAEHQVADGARHEGRGGLDQRHVDAVVGKHAHVLGGGGAGVARTDDHHLGAAATGGGAARHETQTGQGRARAHGLNELTAFHGALLTVSGRRNTPRSGPAARRNNPWRSDA